MTSANTATLSFAPQPKQVENHPEAIASEHSLLEIDREIDLTLDQMQAELEEMGAIGEESRNRFQSFCEAFGQKVDRLGRFIRVMESREAYCRAESARLTARARAAENKVAQTKLLVLYFMESRNLTKMEGPQFTLRRQKNSVDSVRIQNPDSVPMRLLRIEAKFDGALWERIAASLPAHLQRGFLASMQCCVPMHDAIKQEVASGAELDGVSVSRGHHLRVA